MKGLFSPRGHVWRNNTGQQPPLHIRTEGVGDDCGPSSLWYLPTEYGTKTSHLQSWVEGRLPSTGVVPTPPVHVVRLVRVKDDGLRGRNYDLPSQEKTREINRSTPLLSHGWPTGLWVPTPTLSATRVLGTKRDRPSHPHTLQYSWLIGVEHGWATTNHLHLRIEWRVTSRGDYIGTLPYNLLTGWLWRNRPVGLVETDEDGPSQTL